MTEECYPYNVTQSNTSANKCLDNLDTCPNSNSSTSKIVLYVTPPYRVGKSEEEIKTEIYKRGPVQAHTCGVMGVAVDGMNQILVTAGMDGEIRFLGFKKH
ncbi:uncharacterized peptidase C1-like protein F26E4.3 [Saccostrea echinata]|uniref:uncharacterized peptidase C1-like protein F26E4.3 n=1 Tax=Saccostrea echinata TaxID=191078 RepID=UPI002A832000|nr:uncharacterized peptidase C1-like protein F26E4.3 [Saccostrea echinata]